jgi:hypothetical protein
VSGISKQVGNPPPIDSDLALEFHVDPQFIHRGLAAQVLGREAPRDLGVLADALSRHLISSKTDDVRIAALENRLGGLVGRLVTLRAGLYFRREGQGPNERVLFHSAVRVDGVANVDVSGELDPARFEANSPNSNLAGQVHVFVAGIALEADDAAPRIRIRPLIIGFPYFAPLGAKTDAVVAPRSAQINYIEIDQFELNSDALATPVSPSELARLFSTPETRVREAFALILGQPYIPKDRPDETSDLVSEISIRGQPVIAAFAFKGPGGKPRPWTLHPRQMGKNGDQAVKLFYEPANVVIVQHCSRIAESVRHIMEALAVKSGKRYTLIDGANTVRILRRANLFK